MAPTNQTAKKSKAALANESYARALNSGSKESALQIIKEEQPRDYRLRFKRLNKNLDMIFQPPQTPWVSPYDLSSFTNVPQVMRSWADENISSAHVARGSRPISIIIEGESGTGKTAWARSLGKHNYLCGRLDLDYKIFSNDAEYNVIDDVNPQKLKYWKELLGAKSDWQANGKGKPVLVRGGIPSIVLCRPGVGSSYIDYLNRHEGLKSWTLPNATFVVLQEPLFST